MPGDAADAAPVMPVVKLTDAVPGNALALTPVSAVVAPIATDTLPTPLDAALPVSAIVLPLTNAPGWDAPERPDKATLDALTIKPADAAADAPVMATVATGAKSPDCSVPKMPVNDFDNEPRTNPALAAAVDPVSA